MTDGSAEHRHALLNYLTTIKACTQALTSEDFGPLTLEQRRLLELIEKNLNDLINLQNSVVK